MNCPNCGAELKEGSKFCGACGSKVVLQEAAQESAGTEELAAFSVTQPAPDDVVAEGKSLKDEVRFSKGMNAPIEDIPQPKETGIALLDSLNRFGALYHALVDNSVALLNAASFKEGLEKAGKQWYYDHSEDPVITASKLIGSELAASQTALKEARASIAENAALRQQAAEFRDAQKLEGQTSVESAKKSWSKANIVVIIVAATLVLGSFIGGVVEGMAGLIVFGGGAAAFLVFSKKGKEGDARRAQFSSKVVYNQANAQFEETSRRLAASDASLSAQANQLEAKITELMPIAGEIKHNAMERCEFLYAQEMLEIQENMQALSRVCVAQHGELEAMGTIPVEDEWFEVDRLTRFVASGRADTLKEALQLLDTSNYRDADLAMKERLVEGQFMTNMILDSGFQALLSQQQSAMDQQRMQYKALQEQMSVQHAQDMVAQAQQIKLQSEQIKQQAAQNTATERVASATEAQAAAQQTAYQEQADFHQEVRDRFGWNDYNRPDARTSGNPTIGRKAR